MKNPLRIALAGLGTVGGGVVDILTSQAEMVAARAGRKIEIVAVSARDKKKKRSVDTSSFTWVDAPEKLSEANADVVVELMGGSEGSAKHLVEAALKNKKHVVTANKALIAHHGMALAALAEKNHVALAYEGAVAGGIPVIKTIREGLAANKFARVAGILNGTCNFILSTMAEQKREFKDVLKEAQEKGYAEADPGFDIDGIDASHKLTILTTLAFGVPMDITVVKASGIRNISLRDITFAQELGYAIKLLGIATSESAEVYPALVPLASPISRVSGPDNAVAIEGEPIGRLMLEGPGAGAGPTASSVVADLIDIARGNIALPFGIPVAQLKKLSRTQHLAPTTSFYLRLSVTDKAGVLADITNSFLQQKISVESLLQPPHQPDKAVQIVLTTHPTTEDAMQKAIENIAALKTVVKPPTLIRIEEI